ncbi:unnamed protein product, partial [Rotaria sp. Silwood1]
MKFALYGIMSAFILKNVIVIASLFPKVFRTGSSYIEILALILTYVYVLDWYPWQSAILFRCPIQYQLGAMGILLAYINLLFYVRTAPILGLGVYIVMLQVITMKFLRFLPILLIIICGFGFTYWMLLQYQDVYGSPGEALLRTSLMAFDLGYESRLYDTQNGGVGYYKLVYFIFILAALALSIFIINLLIGLAVGEIPSLKTQGTSSRTLLMYNLLSDYEIMRIQFHLLINAVVSCGCYGNGISWFCPHPYTILQSDENLGPM